MENAVETLKETEKHLCELLEKRSIDSKAVQEALEAIRDAISLLTTGRKQDNRLP